MLLYGDQSTDRLLVHLPHGIPQNTFFQGNINELPSPSHSQRKIPVLLIGDTNKKLYPFRNRIAKLIKNGMIPGVIRSSIGYTEMWTSEERRKKNITSDTLDQQVEEYATAMRDAKIVICTRSTRGYSLRKYTEAAMSGALIVGNIPQSDRNQEFQQFVVEINEEDSNKEIVNKIHWWLNNDKEREARATIGQLWSFNYTWERTVPNMVRAWQDFRSGLRGLQFPYQFEQDVQRPFKRSWKDIIWPN